MYEPSISKQDLFARCVPHDLVTPFVERHGRFFEPQAFPKSYRRGKLSLCFANSYRMAIRHKLTYVEGYALGETGMCHLHAWCIDTEGRVLDPTWRTADAYFGIPFQTRYLLAVIKDRETRLGENAYFGLLDDCQAGFPLMKQLESQPDQWLAS